MAQSVEELALDFGSGQDLTVVRSSPVSGSVLRVEPAEDALSLSPSLACACARPLSPLKKNVLQGRLGGAVG